MFVISAGLRKAGSTWLYEITDGLLSAAGHTSARTIRERYGLEKLMEQRNSVLGHIAPHSLEALQDIANIEGSFVVKTHAPPPPKMETLMALPKGPKATFIYRDPRDIAISALEHGQRLRRRGFSQLPFAELHTLPEALVACRSWLRTTYLPWSNTRGALSVSYETLMDDTLEVAKGLCHYLRLNLDDAAIQAVLSPLEASGIHPNSLQGQRLHLNQAKTHRYRTLMNEKEQHQALNILGPWLDLMGYSRTIHTTHNVSSLEAHLKALTHSVLGSHPHNKPLDHRAFG